VTDLRGRVMTQVVAGLGVAIGLAGLWLLLFPDQLISSQRVFVVRSDRLSYELSMATTTTQKPDFLPHLRCDLERVRRSGAGATRQARGRLESRRFCAR
jgi:hypothetical protein